MPPAPWAGLANPASLRGSTLVKEVLTCGQPPPASRLWWGPVSESADGTPPCAPLLFLSHDAMVGGRGASGFLKAVGRQSLHKR